MINSATQRFNMIECQVKPCDVTDQRILRALADVPRENFLPPSQKPFAYLDQDQPLENPLIVSWMLDVELGMSLLSYRSFVKRS